MTLRPLSRSQLQVSMPFTPHLCIDHTKFGRQGFLFCAIDLAARNIVGHCYKENAFQTKDVLQTLSKIVKEHKCLPKI